MKKRDFNVNIKPFLWRGQIVSITSLNIAMLMMGLKLSERCQSPSQDPTVRMLQRVLHFSPGAPVPQHSDDYFLRARGRCRIDSVIRLYELSVAVPRSDTSCSARSISPRAPVPLNAHYYSSHSVFVTVFTPCFCAQPACSPWCKLPK